MLIRLEQSCNEGLAYFDPENVTFLRTRRCGGRKIVTEISFTDGNFLLTDVELDHIASRIDPTGIS